MATREIPPDAWRQFFDEFSRRHEGWLVDVEVLADAGAQLEAEGLPLEGISADRGNASVSLALVSDDRFVEHSILRPAQVRVEEEEGEDDDEVEPGAEAAIEIETEEGEVTILRFQAALQSDEAEGIPAGRGRTR